MQAARMLIVEDDPKVGTELEAFFLKKGYDVYWTREGDQAVRLLVSNPGYDIVLLDLGLPKKNGFDVLKEARHAGVHTPVLILSSRTSEKDKLRGFNLGAEDYVTKPFSSEELAARCRVILRRRQSNADASLEHYLFDDIDINFSSHTAYKNGSELQFTALEFSILHYFIQHRGRTVSRRQLLRDVWNIEEDITTRTIDRHVASLRKKIENDPTDPQYIQTVYGIGYKFTG
jgi:DNA-binding response OmpR family regulator